MTTKQRPVNAVHVVDLGAYDAWLFDLDRVLTKTAAVHATAWTQAFNEFHGAGIADLFENRIDGHVVKERHLAGKPAPDSYLEGAKELGVDPEGPGLLRSLRQNCRLTRLIDDNLCSIK